MMSDITRSRASFWLLFCLLAGAIVIGSITMPEARSDAQYKETRDSYLAMIKEHRQLIERLAAIVNELEEKDGNVSQIVTVGQRELHPALIHVSHQLEELHNERIKKRRASTENDNFVPTGNEAKLGAAGAASGRASN